MILGNRLRANIIGVRRFYQSIRQGKRLSCSNWPKGDIGRGNPSLFTVALAGGIGAMIGMMATVGLVSLPGMMTGVILGGSDPSVAVMYQIAIMIAIFTGTSITILLAILLSRKAAFDSYGLLRTTIFR